MDNRLFGAGGQLRDFEPHQGDQTIAAQARRGSSARWGGRVRLSLPSGAGVLPFSDRQNATLIETGDLGRVVALDVQLRFALADATGNAILPFSRVFPQASPGIITVKIRRGYDVNAPVTVDAPIFLNATSGALGPQQTGDILKLDVVNVRSLGLTVEFTPNGAPTSTSLWVEAVATPVDTVATREQVIGWGITPDTTPRVEQFSIAAAAASTNFLAPKQKRVQFIICNTSTNADLYVAFGPTASVALATMVLPRNIFATYESPVGGYAGQVTGIWTAAPTGAALVTEGSY